MGLTRGCYGIASRKGHVRHAHHCSRFLVVPETRLLRSVLLFTCFSWHPLVVFTYINIHCRHYECRRRHLRLATHYTFMHVHTNMRQQTFYMPIFNTHTHTQTHTHTSPLVSALVSFSPLASPTHTHNSMLDLKLS